MNIWRLSFLVLASIGTALCQQSYTEVEWPLPSQTAAGTPGPWHFGEVAAVAAAANGRILVLHRGGHPVIEFDSDGKLISSWGDGMISGGKVTAIPPENRTPGGPGYTVVYGPAGCYSCGAHSIRVDTDGYIWLVDAGAHVVYKMDTQWRVLLQLGEKGVSGTGRGHFNLPTDVAFAPNGDVYVSDGYGSARVVKFSSAGKYSLEWGKRGTGPGEFELPHNLVVDSQGRVYVTDRENERIQIFDSSGKFLDQWEGVGRVSALFMTDDQYIWAGGVLRDLDGEIVTSLPGNVGGHGTSVSATGEVFVAQLGRRVQKFVGKDGPSGLK